MECLNFFSGITSRNSTLFLATEPRSNSIRGFSVAESGFTSIFDMFTDIAVNPRGPTAGFSLTGTSPKPGLDGSPRRQTLGVITQKREQEQSGRGNATSRLLGRTGDGRTNSRGVVSVLYSRFGMLSPADER